MKQGKNKTKLWRRMAEKTYDGVTEIRTGRRLRDALRGLNHNAAPYPLLITLMKSAGLATPVYDAVLNERINQLKGEMNAA